MTSSRESSLSPKGRLSRYAWRSVETLWAGAGLGLGEQTRQTRAPEEAFRPGG